MSDRRVVWFMVVVALVGTTAAGVSLAPTAALFSDTDTFEDNQLGAADDWERVFIDASVTPKMATVNGSVTIEATLENVGAGPVVADYEVFVDNASVNSGIVELASGENRKISHEFNTTETGDIDWQVTANNETKNGTLTVENSTVEVKDITSGVGDGDSTAPGGNETDNGAILDNNSESESENSIVENDTESDNETNEDNGTIMDDNGGSEQENSTDRSQDDEPTDDGSGETDSTSDGSDTEEKEEENKT